MKTYLLLNTVNNNNNNISTATIKSFIGEDAKNEDLFAVAVNDIVNNKNEKESENLNQPLQLFPL